MNREQFWTMADDTRLETEYLIDDKLRYLQRASWNNAYKTVECELVPGII